LLSFSSCLAYFGGPVKDGIRSRQTVGALIQADFAVLDAGSGHGSIACQRQWGMRELSGEQRTERKWYPGVSAGDASQARAAWFRYVIGALGISALGLVVAASLGITTKAQTVDGGLTALPMTSSTVAPQEKQPAATQAEALAALARRDAPATNGPARSPALQAAIVKEQAAQRDELLAKTAEEVSRAAEAASDDGRQRKLTAGDRASREEGARIAAENLRRAIAARVAAANRRQAAESARDDHETAASTAAPRPGDSGSSGSSGSSGGFGGGGGGVAPVPGAVIGAAFGEYGSWSRYHTGIDFRAGHGTPIRAVKSGVVLYAGNSGDWAGNHVAIKHGDGMTTMSSHMSSIAARAGQTVRAGQIIGYVGATGRAFGAHLHFELYPAGVKYGDVYSAINPQPWLRANGVTTH
jgi:murein DD-endopeptidase MepM/ murein hydrolase activator NlpD